ncbi:hypothetical protein QQF64_009094 [Cirrhinus molitorella]|uniref:SPRY-associated domain-containing protein n=1 Tax=Cirrhinus molitorella TaxID=172907 RepID=A0ABR3M068_9TELE
MDKHKFHYFVSAAEQRTEKQKQLKEMQKMFQQRIQQREKDLQQLRAVLLSHKISAQTAVEELIRLIRDQEKFAVFQVEGRLMQLEQEINDLRRRDAELEQLSHKQDLFLQSFQSLSAPPEFTDVNDDLFSSFLTFHGLGECVNQLKDKVKDFCKEDLKKISDRVTFTNIAPRTRNEFLQYSQQLTFDPNTAQKNIHLSENNRVVTGTHIEQSYPDHPDRFEGWHQFHEIKPTEINEVNPDATLHPIKWSEGRPGVSFPRLQGIQKQFLVKGSRVPIMHSGACKTVPAEAFELCVAFPPQAA